MSPAEVWLIDGWNVLHGLSAKGSGRRMESEELLSLMADFAAHQECRVVVVWDGHGPGGNPKLVLPVTSSVESLYSADKTADAVLERYLFDHRSTARLVVVTDDQAMTTIARGSGARVFSVLIFGQIVEEAKKGRRDWSEGNRADQHGFNRPFGEDFRKKGWKSE